MNNCLAFTAARSAYLITVFAIVCLAIRVASLVVPAVADCTNVALFIMAKALVNFNCSAAYSEMVARAVAFLC